MTTGLMRRVTERLHTIRDHGALAAPDVKTALLLFAAGAAVAMAYLSATDATPSFYQGRLGPAVMLACGRGFVNPDVSRCPSLEAFLNLEADRLSPGDIPEDLPVSKPTAFQAAHRYLYTAVALCWIVSGISWPALLPLFGVLYGITVACAYGLFRLGMRRGLAVVAALLVLASPVHLSMLVLLRDYCKAPFLLAAFLILGHLVSQPFKRSTLLWLAAIGGAVVGVGIGFRKDLLVCVPAFVVAILLFLPGRLRQQIPTKLSALGLFLLCFLVFGFPILTCHAGGSNTCHVFLLGLTDPFDTILGLSRPPYRLAPLYRDEFVASIVNGHAYLAHGDTNLVEFYTPEYSRYARELLLTAARHFPADMAIRAWAAVIRVLDDLPFANLTGFFNQHLVVPSGVANDFILKLYQWRLALLRPFQGLGVALAAVALLLISAKRPRLAAFGLLFLLYFVGHTALQFALRHVFHLEFVALWALGFLVDQALRGAATLASGAGRARLRHKGLPARWWWSAPVKRTAAFTLGTCLALLGPLYGLRWYQHAHVGRLMQAYLAADKEALPLTYTDLADGNVLVAVEEAARAELLFAEQADMAAKTEYLVAEFLGHGPAPVECILWYDAARQANDMTTRATIPPCRDGLAARYFFPIYETTPEFWLGRRTFKGLVLPKGHASHFTGLYRIKHPAALPLLLYTVLPSDWETAQRFQVLMR